MTVSTQTNTSTYTGNGVTVDFPTGYPFVSDDSLLVTLIRVATGERVVLTDGYSYSVAGAGNPAGGTVTTLVDIGSAMITVPTPLNPLSSAFQLEIRRDTPAIQPLNLVDNDGAPAEAMELEFDRVTMAIIDLNSRIADAIAGVPSALALTNGSVPGADPSELVPIYSGLTGTTHKLRQIGLTATPLRVQYVNSELNYLVFTGLLRDFSYPGATPDNSGGGFGAQVRGTGAVLALWDDAQVAGSTRWGFSSPGADAMSFCAFTDALDAQDEFLQFTRSGATAVSTKLMKQLDVNAKDIINVGRLLSVANYVEMSEMTAPAAGAVNTGRIYMEDNGAGKTRLMVKFNTGAAQQIAIQP